MLSKRKASEATTVQNGEIRCFALAQHDTSGIEI